MANSQMNRVLQSLRRRFALRRRRHDGSAVAGAFSLARGGRLRGAGAPPRSDGAGSLPSHSRSSSRRRRRLSSDLPGSGAQSVVDPGPRHRRQLAVRRRLSHRPEGADGGGPATGEGEADVAARSPGRGCLAGVASFARSGVEPPARQVPAPVVLCDLEGNTRKEAAQRLGWPEGTLSGRLSRARVLLARRLARRGLTLSGGAVAVALSYNAAWACLPAPLLTSTVQAASLVAAGHVAAGAISAPVVALTEGVLKAMFVTKLKIVTSIALTMGVLGIGFGLYLTRAAAQPQPGETTLAPAPGAPVRCRPRKKLRKRERKSISRPGRPPCRSS